MRVLWVYGIIVVLIVATFTLTSSEKNSYPAASLYLLLILMIHLRRKDKNFLKINISQFQPVYMLEYLLLSSPLLICLVLHGKWLVVLFAVVGALLISAIDYNFSMHRKTVNTRVQKLIPSDLYEWKAGVRKNLMLLLGVYGLGVCLSYFVAAIPIAMVIIGLIIFDFFTANESWQMLLSFEKGPKKMLCYKIKRHALLYALINLPLVILYMLFHADLWYIPVIALIVLLSIHIYMLTIKFAYFEINGGNGANFILQLIGIVFGLIPIMIPLLWLFSLFFFKKACTNLIPLLHDYD
ncbi:MAG: hypothetical protein LBU22_05900 [Dysgonamonadaceae bacterium]|nr:hypothetical protein [Dysgonamonadaceae bacterium]